MAKIPQNYSQTVRQAFNEENIVNYSRNKARALPSHKPNKEFSDFRIYLNRFYKLIYIRHRDRNYVFDFLDFFYLMYSIHCGPSLHFNLYPKRFKYKSDGQVIKIFYNHYLITTKPHSFISMFLDETKHIFQIFLFEKARQFGCQNFKNSVLNVIDQTFNTKLRQYRCFDYVYSLLKVITEGSIYENFTNFDDVNVQDLSLYITLL